MVSIIGPNGSGKSTLIKIISHEINNYKGEIYFQNKTIPKWNINKLSQSRAILSQDNYLSFPFTALDVIKMGRFPYKESNNTSTDICNKIVEIFKMKDKLKQNYMTLSGGEKQRVQLARIIAQIWSEDNLNNKLLLLDEPTSFLDIKHQHELFDFLKYLNNKGLTILMVLHDINHALSNSNKILLLKDSKMVDYGKSERVITEKNLLEAYDTKLKLTKTENSKRPIIH